MGDSEKNEFESYARPKILISDKTILISDPPFAWRIFLTFFCLCLAIIAYMYKENSDKLLGMLFGLAFSIVFLYDALSLQRVRVDLQNKIIYRISLNPLENLINHILKRPSKIPFSNVQKTFSDFTVAFGGASQRYYVYIRSNNRFNLKMGTFNKEAEAISFAAFLNKKIKQA